MRRLDTSTVYALADAPGIYARGRGPGTAGGPRPARLGAAGRLELLDLRALARGLAGEEHELGAAPGGRHGLDILALLLGCELPGPGRVLGEQGLDVAELVGVVPGRNRSSQPGGSSGSEGTQNTLYKWYGGA
jgi:hypothetical protein